jgi:hypothetical protein
MRKLAAGLICSFCLASTGMPGGARAQGFTAAISPPRFELAIKPGERVRQVMEMTNPNIQSTRFRIKTADWRLDSDGGLSFFDELQPGSCRPWVAIEAREVTVGASGKYRYRFEIAVPESAAIGECRFVMLVEGDEQQVKAGDVSFPVSGRLGVIVYVVIGDAAPKLDVIGTRLRTINGATLPVVDIRNSGNAHGRISGFLSGTDASGKKLDFDPATLPILPGESRGIVLSPSTGRDEPIKIEYPVTIRGTLEWGDKSIPFEQRFAP